MASKQHSLEYQVHEYFDGAFNIRGSKGFIDKIKPEFLIQIVMECCAKIARSAWKGHAKLGVFVNHILVLNIQI